MINILIVSNQNDIYAYQLCDELNGDQYAMSVTYTSESQKKFIPNTVKSYYVPPFRHKFKMASIRSIRKIINKENIDLIYCVNQSSLSNALFASLGKKTKIIAYRGTQAKIRPTDPTYYLGILNPRVSHVICETADIKEKLKKYFSRNQLSVNTKPFKTEWVQDAVKQPKKFNNIPKDAFIVTCLANAKRRPFKGLSYLIEAARLIKNKNIHIIHIGNYDDIDFQRAQSLPNADQFHFTGFLSDAVHYLADSDVCICPSTRDASPRSLREAMACEKACVVTDIPCARDLVIHNKTGLIIPPKSPKAIASSLEFLAENPKKNEEFGKEGKKHLQNAFNLNTYIKIFENTFQTLKGK